MRTVQPELIDRCIAIGKHTEERVKYFDKKVDLARNDNTREKHYTSLKLYRNFNHRVFNLIFSLKYPKEFGESNAWERFTSYRSSEQYKKQEAERIATGKEKFYTKHYYSMWFMSNSLGADYGTHTCDKCGRVFHHSPSRITKAAKQVYDCVCGYCTNEIIHRDWNSTPYD